MDIKSIVEADYIMNKTMNVVYNYNEKFKQFPLDFNYIIGEYGSIYNIRQNALLNQRFDKDGYLRAYVSGKLMPVHRVVAITFLPYNANYESLQINHIDGNKMNNHYSNLEWCTCEENINHAISHNLRAINERHWGARFTNNEIELICSLLEKGYSGKDIANYIGREWNLKFSDMLTKIRRKVSWREISSKYNIPRKATISQKCIIPLKSKE